ncbi:cupin domain-containing protein [Pseudoalteromonas xiamenensis]|uniref:cupin domain-containing protein n=1 Tax=Pseudoalteromonas xiamenensis TaxID=882626 RepID=UPI0027E491E3|nr:cupin domain-containing protein [Pseudoalteromonas xiamenensis]WMN59595.1 cupin domain-containing protein [Pseudoalteromonas xiamenensis]
MGNLFNAIPTDLSEEVFESIITSQSIRVERIVSKGHETPENSWYDQDEHEWVCILQGRGTLEFADGSTKTLNVGDYVNIPAHVKHRVSATSVDPITIWLAIFYR